jgi:dihydropyrimidinase
MAGEPWELVVRGGLLVTAGGTAHADLGIANGRIRQIGGPMAGRRELDAAGLVVLPGMIDPHVHLTPDLPPAEGPAWVDTFQTGTAAALAGGVTTVGNMMFPEPGETPLGTLARGAALAQGQIRTDLLLHPAVTEPTDAVLAEIPTLPEHGVGSLKVFMVEDGFDRDADRFATLLALAGEAGVLTLVHAEDRAIIAEATRRLASRGEVGLAHYPESRPIPAETAATARIVDMARAVAAPVYLVHLSCAQALRICRRARAAGAAVYVETRPMYLHLTDARYAHPEAGIYVGQPPLRRAEDVAALWRGLADGAVDTVASDHAPWSRAAKVDPAHTIERLRPGVENLETELPMLYSEGVRTGRITLERLAAVTSGNAARLFGLWPQKGSIAVGADADLVLLDPGDTRRIDRPRHSAADHSPYEGWKVTGWPRFTLRRGEVAYAEGEVTAAPGSGQILRSRRRQ